MDYFQLTIPAVGSQPLQVSSTQIMCCHVIFEADDGNGAAAFVGDSAMATDGSQGIRLNNSATTPGRLEIGPFTGNIIDLRKYYIVGTETQKINVLYEQM